MPPTLSAPPPARKTLGTRLLVVFFAVLALALLGSAIGIWSLQKIEHSAGQMVRQDVRTERLIADAYRHQAINSERYKAVALSSEPEVGEILGADIAATQRLYDALIAELGERLQGAEDQALLAVIAHAGGDFLQARTALVAARDSGLTERIRRVYGERFVPSSQRLLAALGTLSASQREAIDAAAHEVQRLGDRARTALLAFSGLALALGTVLALWLVRSITRPIALASTVADRVAALDLRHDIRGHARDESGRMLTSLGVMQQALRGLVAQVRGSAHSLNAAASDIAGGNAELSERTEATAASLQQTAASLAQMAARVTQSAQAAQRAQQVAATATTVAHEGGTVVAEVERTMAGIHQSADQIVDIIGVIDSIAFQTNILALNAAVEAAHAGSQGRGFAVVAAEVRSLATRSAAAAREIKALITASVAQMQAGSALAGQAGSTMQRIVRSIQEAEHMMQDITAATQAQNRDIGHIHAAVARLDQMTHANAALVEESAAASNSLHLQAQELSALISRFVLPGEDGADAAFAAQNPVPPPRRITGAAPTVLLQAA